MSEQSSEGAEQTSEDGPLSVSDDELPEDLQPGDDNPWHSPRATTCPTTSSRTPRAARAGTRRMPRRGGDAAFASSGEASSEAESDDPGDSARPPDPARLGGARAVAS